MRTLLLVIYALAAVICGCGWVSAVPPNVVVVPDEFTLTSTPLSGSMYAYVNLAGYRTTGDGGGGLLYQGPSCALTTTAPTISTGSTTITVASVTGITPGMTIYAYNTSPQPIPPGDVITAVNTSTFQITLAVGTVHSESTTTTLVLGGNGGSVFMDYELTTMTPTCYYRQSFPNSVLEWGADPSGADDTSFAVQTALNAATFNTSGNLLFFPAGIYKLHDIVLPNPTDGVHIACAGRNVTTLKLFENADSFMFSNRYLHTGQNPPIEINDCMIDLNNNKEAGTTPGIIIEGTQHTKIHDNEIDNGIGPAIAIVATDSDPDGNCSAFPNGDPEISRNVFIGSNGPAVSQVNSTNSNCLGVSDGLIIDNIFSANGADTTEYQVSICCAGGWSYQRNKSFGSLGCGDLIMTTVGSSVVTNNRFDSTGNAFNGTCDPSPSTGPESIVLIMGESKGFTFSGNSMNNVSPSYPNNATTWDALEIVNSVTNNPMGTASDNVFASRTITLNAINYNGTYAKTPLVAVGNAYNNNVTQPSSTPGSQFITGSGQFVTFVANATQMSPSTHYFPISGYTNSAALGESSANQVWPKGGLFTINTTSQCGILGTAAGSGNTYTFTLRINGATPVGGPLCTFSGSNVHGVGSGGPTTISPGQTVDWSAVQSPSSNAANPSVSIVFMQ